MARRKLIDIAKGHLLWNAGRTISDYIETSAARLVEGKYVLEFGAGAGLPSIVAALKGAAQVVVTDYPDVDLVENMRYNCEQSVRTSNIAAEVRKQCTHQIGLLFRVCVTLGVGLPLGRCPRQTDGTSPRKRACSGLSYAYFGGLAIQPLGTRKAGEVSSRNTATGPGMRGPRLFHTLSAMVTRKRHGFLPSCKGKRIQGQTST